MLSSVTKPTASAEQAFLDDLDKKLWNAADRLRSNLDAAVYKHAILGLTQATVPPFKFANKHSTGTKMLRTNWVDLSFFKTAVPPPAVAKVFNDQILPLIAQIHTNLHQSPHPRHPARHAAAEAAKRDLSVLS